MGACAICSSEFGETDEFCPGCGYQPEPPESVSIPLSVAGATALVAYPDWGVFLIEGEQPQLRLAWATSGEELPTEVRVCKRALSELVDLGLVAEADPQRPELPGQLAYSMPPGELLSDAKLEDRRRRHQLLLGLAENLEESSRSALVWLDLSPDLVWLGADRLVPLGVWRILELDRHPEDQAPPVAWTSLCAPPECGMGQLPTPAAQYFSWGKLASELLSEVERYPAWQAVLSGCLLEDPAERLSSLEDLLAELRRALRVPVCRLGMGSEARGVQVVGASDRGPLRHEQQDRWGAWVADDGSRGFAAVADGMGGGELRGLAAEWALDELLAWLPDAQDPLDSEELRQAACRASERVLAFREGLGLLEAMGTTLTALVWSGEERVVLHVGDSRGYCSRAGEPFVQKTTDHVTDDPEAAQAGAITSAIDGGEFRADVTPFHSMESEAWLLCSDGFWTPAERGALMPSLTVGDALEPGPLLAKVRELEEEQLELLQIADNATVVAVSFSDHPPTEPSP